MDKDRVTTGHKTQYKERKLNIGRTCNDSKNNLILYQSITKKKLKWPTASIEKEACEITIPDLSRPHVQIAIISSPQSKKMN